MKKFSKKGILLVAGAVTVCAFVIPSMASGASWGVVGSEHTLDSPDVGYTQTTAAGPVNTICSRSSLTAKVASAANLEVTSAAFGGLCTMNVSGGGVCNMTLTATRLPWTATAVTTNNIQIHGVHFDLRLEQSAAGTCPSFFVGLDSTITGTLTGGQWTAGGHEIILSNAEGLVQHSGLGVNQPLTLRGTFRDTQQTLTVS